VPDPLAALPTPNQLPSPPGPVGNPNPTINNDSTLNPGIYSSITVEDFATATFRPGVYVFRGSDGLTIRDNARVVGNGVTIYLACSGYPTPCSGSGSRFRLEDNGRFQANPPLTGDYAGLSIFADRGNTRTLRHQSNADLRLSGGLYGASTPVSMEDDGDLEVDSLVAVSTLRTSDDGSVEVTYDPSVLLPGVGLPVLIR
jgi:hypothetical protein